MTKKMKEPSRKKKIILNREKILTANVRFVMIV